MFNLITGKKYRIYIKIITLIAVFIFIFENIGYSFSNTLQNKASLRKPLDFNDQEYLERYSTLMINAKAGAIRDHLTPGERDYLSNPLRTNCLLVALGIKPAYWSRTGMSSEELNMLQEIAKNLGLRFVSYRNDSQMLCFVYNPRSLAKVFLQNRIELLKPDSYITDEVRSKDFISILGRIDLQAIIDARDFSKAEQGIAQLDEYLAHVGYREKDLKAEGEVFPIGLAMGYGSKDVRMFLQFQKERRTALLHPITSARHNIWFTVVDEEAGQKLLGYWVKASDIAASIIAGVPDKEDIVTPVNSAKEIHPWSWNTVKNRVILPFLNLVNRYGLYRLASHPEFLAFFLFAVLSSTLNPLAFPFIVAGGTIAHINSSDEEWVRLLFINVLTFEAEQVIDVEILEEKMKDSKFRAIIANFRLRANDKDLINKDRKGLGMTILSDPEIQAKFEDFRKELFEKYNLDLGYIVKDKSLTTEEKNGPRKKKKVRLSHEDDIIPQDSDRTSLQRGQDRPGDLEGRLFLDPSVFWRASDITWGQKLACLRQVINERGFSGGLGVTVPFLDDEEMQELLKLISKEPRESPLHELAGAIRREKEKRKAEQDRRIARIQENIAEAKRLQAEGELQAAMERAEEALVLSPDNQEALSLRDILAQELENRRKEADIENRLRSGLKTLYENRIILRDKKIAKEERVSLENASRDARLLIKTLSIEYASVYLSILKEYEKEARFYEDMLEILIQRVFELERDKAAPILGGISAISAKAMYYFWQNKSRLKNNPDFRKVLLGFMLSHPETDIAVLNSYLRFERDFIINSVLEQREGEDDYMDLLLKLMVREGRHAGEDRGTKSREELKNGTLEITRIIIDRDIDKLDYVLELLLNGTDFDLGERIFGYLSSKINNFTMRVLDNLSGEEEVFAFSEIFLASVSFHERHSRQDISNTMKASLVRILERATDFVYEKSSFELPRNVFLFIEYLRNKGKLPESVFSVQTELIPYLEEHDYDRLVEALKKGDIPYKERFAILYRIAILWTGILKGGGNLKEIKAMCQESDPLTRAYLYYALALVRSPKHKKMITEDIMNPELRRIIGRVVLSGRIDRDVLMNILYELKLGDSYNKLFMAYGVVASLGIKGSISVEVPGENLSGKILKGESVSSIKEALIEAVQNDWIINDAENKKIIEDIVWLLGQPESAQRRALDKVLNLLSIGKGSADVQKDYEKIISDTKAGALGLGQGSINVRQSL